MVHAASVGGGDGVVQAIRDDGDGVGTGGLGGAPDGWWWWIRSSSWGLFLHG